MPIYKYKCKVCGQIYEKLSSISERNEMKSCPYCGKMESVKLVSGFIAKTSSNGTCSTSSGG